jgi:acyl carrier protein
MVSGIMEAEKMSFTEFCQLLSEISKVPVEQIHETSSFRNDLGIDSLQMVHVLVELADKLGLDLNKISGHLDFRTVMGLYQSLVAGETENEPII